jgi:hypothetical protein
MYLHVEHRKKDFKKTWKLESGHKAFSIGHSRHADLRLDKSHGGISGVIEFTKGQWNFTHLNSPSGDQHDRFIPISGPTIIPIFDGELHVLPFDRQVHLFRDDLSKKQNPHQKQWIWLVWKRNDRVWYSEHCNLDEQVRWPHNRRLIKIIPTAEWQNVENEGIVLSYKLTSVPDTRGLFNGAFKGVFDPSLRPYLVGALIACLLTGFLSLLGEKNVEPVALAKPTEPPVTESTVIRLEKKPIPVQPPKNAVAQALAQTAPPKSAASPKVAARRALGQVFSQIGRHSLKNIATGTGPKTISITATTQPTPSNSAKSFKVLGSLGSGTGLHPSQFVKGNTKDGGVGLGNGPLGGANLGQISQGNVGQGDLGLLHKESQVTGGLDREVIAKFIQSQKGKILYCYERQLSANPGLFGKVSVKFQIAPGGEVETSNITENTLGNNNVESCLLGLIAQWRFPKPEGGVRVLVSYPFVFKSLN